MSKEKPNGERDTEEILNIIESGNVSEYVVEEIDNADEIQLVLYLPNNGDDSAKDDASSDCEESSTNFQDIGRDILAEKGYNKLPCRSLYWETRSDSNNHLVSHAVSRNTFEKIHQYLHFDNSKLDPCDKVYKVRPLLDHPNGKFCQFVEPMGNNFSLDEAMEPYYGHHGMEQLLRGKPMSYSFRF
ncbi:Hypothetical predicted protein [Octopus vulgaris]|uniref:PiggyBac transposable element-derived protein domain-containing protein n=1 Tax=Octopus vulgaris TaxID=6645 RepID=A0AA36B654_OCTVU|nr:Hypothetical predicted protein [Octopus vulgaris]